MKDKPKTSLTWKQRIMLATTGRNSRGVFLWYSHDLILKIVSEQEGINVRDTYRSLSCYLHGLVKSGHLERALKPRELSLKVQDDGRPEYLYRQTGKPYLRGIPVLKSCKNKHSVFVQRSTQGHELWRLHRKLPKWFRLMMMD